MGDLQPGISIVIPTWNGWHLLEENLESVLEALATYRGETSNPGQVVVVDDGSEDGTAARVARHFPTVELVRRQHNGGFAIACNSGFERCRHQLTALLNNDVRVHPRYLLEQAAHFVNEGVFAVTARVFEWDPPVFATGGKRGRFRRGFWSVWANYETEGGAAEAWICRRRLLSFYAVGGFATYSTAKLRLLGGFSEILSPFHWEDIDLSYRAWKRGWEVRYEPRSLAHHRISATIGSHFSARHVERTATRNRLLFHWINLHSGRLWMAHLVMIAGLVATRILALDLAFYRALAEAVRLWPQVRRLRRRERLEARRSDLDLVALFERFFREAPVRVYRGRDDVLRHHPGPPAAMEEERA